MQKPQGSGAANLRIEQRDRRGKVVFSVDVSAEARQQLGMANTPDVTDYRQLEQVAYLYGQAQQREAQQKGQPSTFQMPPPDPVYPGFWKLFWKSVFTPLTPEQKDTRRLFRKEQKRLRKLQYSQFGSS